MQHLSKPAWKRFQFVGFCALLVFAAGFFLPSSANAQSGEPWVGVAAIRETNSQVMSRAQRADAQPPKPGRVILRRYGHRPGEQTIEFPIHISTNGVAPSSPGSPLVSQPGPFGTNGTPLAFTGATLADTGSYPPDTMGAVGPAQFIVAVNGRLRSFAKATGLADGALNASMDSFFNSVMTPVGGAIIGNFTSDPRIRYDRLSGRWIVLIIDVPYTSSSPFTTAPNRFLIAVSDSSVIMPGTVWSFFQLQHDLVSPAGDTDAFADYPTLGVDASALYIGVNVFGSSGSFVNTTAYVVRKSSLLGGGPVVATAFRNLITRVHGSMTGPYTPQGVDHFDPAATEGYFIGMDYTSTSKLQLRRVANPGGTPSLSGNVTVNVSSFAAPIKVPSLGSAVPLDGLDNRLLAAHYRGGSLWTTHNVGVNSSGGTSGVTRNGVRWYQLNGIPTGQTPGVQQSGTIYDASSTNRFYWMGSVMVSGQGHAVLGFSSTSSTEYVNAAVAGRLANAAAGAFGPPMLYTASSTAYNPPYDRWGDYSYTSLDPSDDMTLWTIQQYCNANNSYAVQIGKIYAPPPTFPTNGSPGGVYQGKNSVSVSFQGVSQGGSGYFDPGVGFSNHLSAAISGAGVTVNSLTVNNATNLTLNLTVAANAAPGLRAVVITNPDGQSVTNANIFSVLTNRPPVLAAISNRTIFELTTLVITNSATDPNSNALTFNMLNAPVGAILNPATGVFSWTPTEAQGPGTNTISVVVTDNGLPPLSATQSFTVFVLESNAAPTLAPISNLTLFEGELLIFTNVATDPDIPANALAFSLLNAPANATLDAATGVFAWVPDESQGPGISNITIRVTDNGLPPLSATQSFTVFVLESNSPPMLASISNRTLFLGETLTFTNAAIDPDVPANTLSFSMLNAPTNAALDASTGVFAWTPTPAQAPATNIISIVVTDDGSPSLSATQGFTIIVLVSNQPPVLASVADRIIHAGTTLVITNTASDADVPTNTLTFNLDIGAATGASVAATNGVFTWTPGDAFAETTNNFTVRVTDDGAPPLSAAKSFTVIVVSRPMIQSVSLSNGIVTLTWNAVVGQSYELQMTTNLSSPAWLNVPGLVVPTSSLATGTNSTDSEAQEFYRIHVLP